ncbi:hypothetical protein KVC_1869 [Ketogulonicigenium vulgare]|nr:hypothetical protein KVC_1869 [Ketogulonicigenium vulgare]
MPQASAIDFQAKDSQLPLDVAALISRHGNLISSGRNIDRLVGHRQR